MRWTTTLLIMFGVLAACGSTAEKGSEPTAAAESLSEGYRGTMVTEWSAEDGVLVDRYQDDRVFLERATDVDGMSRWLAFFDDEYPLHFDPSDPKIPAQRPIIAGTDDTSMDVTSGTWSVSGETLSLEVSGFIEGEFDDGSTKYLFHITFTGAADDRGQFPLVDQPLQGYDGDGQYDGFGGFAFVDGDMVRLELHPNTTSSCDASQFGVSPLFIMTETDAVPHDRLYLSSAGLDDPHIWLSAREPDGSGHGTGAEGRMMIDEIDDTRVKGAIVVDDDGAYFVGKFDVPVCPGMREALDF